MTWRSHSGPATLGGRPRGPRLLRRGRSRRPGWGSGVDAAPARRPRRTRGSRSHRPLLDLRADADRAAARSARAALTSSPRPASPRSKRRPPSPSPSTAGSSSARAANAASARRPRSTAPAAGSCSPPATASTPARAASAATSVWSRYVEFVPAYTNGTAPFGAFVAGRNAVFAAAALGQVRQSQLRRRRDPHAAQRRRSQRRRRGWRRRDDPHRPRSSSGLPDLRLSRQIDRDAGMRIALRRRRSLHLQDPRARRRSRSAATGRLGRAAAVG